MLLPIRIFYLILEQILYGKIEAYPSETSRSVNLCNANINDMPQH